MTYTTLAPTVTQERTGQCDPHDVYTHPAYGTIVLTHTTGNKGPLFGSNAPQIGAMRIAIHRAELHRNLNRDWLHPVGAPLVELEMTHSQFAEFLTGVGRGEGTPVTLTVAPADGSALCNLPGIEPVETANERSEREIEDAVTRKMERIHEQTQLLEDMIEKGDISKKKLREIVSTLRRQVDQAPGDLSFVVKSAKEEIAKAVSDSKIEIEAFVGQTVKRVGLNRIQDLCALSDRDEHKHRALTTE